MGKANDGNDKSKKDAAAEKIFAASELDSAINDNITAAKEFFHQNPGTQEWCGRLVIYMDKKEDGKRLAALVGMPEMPGTTDERCQLMMALGAKLASDKMRPVAAVSIFESWASIGDASSIDPAVRPSEDPNRKEVIAFAGMTADGRTSMSCVDIVRGADGGITLGDTRVIHRADASDGSQCANFLLEAMFQGFITQAFAELMLGKQNGGTDKIGEDSWLTGEDIGHAGADGYATSQKSWGETKDKPDWDKVLRDIPDGVPKDLN